MDGAKQLPLGQEQAQGATPHTSLGREEQGSEANDPPRGFLIG